VAHVDHGKTTLVDALLQGASGSGNLNDRAMDSDDLERQRGITILSKSTSVQYKDNLINIVDTPGHADFGGEVERVLSMVDGVCLVVDATDGPMPQSKYVLRKALERNLKPIVVINKIDRPTSRLEEVENEVFDLFCALDATDEQLEYTTVFAIGRSGWSGMELPENAENVEQNMEPLLDAIVEHIPAPVINVEDGFRMLITIMESDSSLHFGKLLLTGRVLSGSIKVGDKVAVLDADGNTTGETQPIMQILKREGTTRFEIEEAQAGDIVTLAGVQARSRDTLCTVDQMEKGPIEAPTLDPPTISMFFSVNDSPFAGNKELSGGNKLTSQMVKERLDREAETNIAIQVKEANNAGRDAYEVLGRGEMQLGILVENMRREGFELSISPPQALLIKDDKGNTLEPIEEFSVDVQDTSFGTVMETLIARKGELTNSVSNNDGSRQRLTFTVPTRGTVGLRAEIIRKTSGDAIVSSVFLAYEPFRGKLGEVRKGALVASETGVASTYALDSVQARGEMFISPGAHVYTGLIVGEHSRTNDLEVNVAKTKKLTNMRAAGKDEAARLVPPRVLPLEEAIGYIGPDELLEVTPLAVRMRKAILDPSRRPKKK